jgi:Tfp pilus assembly protein PilV
MVFDKKIRQNRTPRAGMTLVEVMMATVVFVMIAIGTSTAIIQAYRLSIQVRYQDMAMNGLKAMADQFQHSVIYNTSKTSGVRKDLLTVTTSPTGTGLSWSKALNTYASSNSADVTADATIPTASAQAFYHGTSTGLIVYFGADTANGVTGTPVTFTRHVTSLVSEDGTDRLIKGTFTATFTLLNKPTTLSVSAIRNLCPSDLK